MFKALMYHYVDDNIQNPMCVSKKKFTDQIIFLKSEGYKFLSLKEVEDIVLHNKPCEKSIVITFDDGYKNTFQEVLPILIEYKVKATVSLCSSYLHEETCEKPTIHLSQEFGNVEDVEKWIVEGNDIAGHSYDHKKLSHLTNEEIEYEVNYDYKILAETFKQDINCFFYPFGSVNAFVEKVVSAKYKFAFVTDEGGRPTYENRYRIHRICVRPEWSVDDLRSALNRE